jgi:deazaflavin-dependent oxidoreductase (nitroreductase family)
MLNPLLPDLPVPAWIARIANLGSRSPFGVWFARSHVRVYRRTNGRVGGRWLGAPVLLLAVVGRRTGELRETPTIYLQVRDVAVVMPANAGHPRPPAWWLNLRDVGTAQVRIGADCFRVRPRVIDGAEYARTLVEFRRICPSAGEYARLAGHPLPLVALERTGDARPGAGAPGARSGGRHHFDLGVLALILVSAVTAVLAEFRLSRSSPDRISFFGE